MAEDQPFHMLFETFGRTPLVHADSVNREAHDQLIRWLDVPTSREGGCILLRAPRAGHGKTHLLSRMRHRFTSTHEAILLRASRGYQIDAATVLEDVVRHLLDEQPGHLGLTRMDVLARRLMASALVPLVESGEVPCEDRQAAIDALRKDPLGTFDFHNPAAVTAQWAKESFSALSERLLPHLARSCDLPGREINFWLQTLFHHSSASLGDHRRHQVLEDKVRNNAAGEAGMMNRLEALLALICLGKRVVLIADDLEGFSSDPSAALNLATLIMALRQSVSRLDVVLSLNLDVWEEVFAPCLSDGLADRLSERTIDLRALSEADMVALLDSRAPGKGSSLLATIDRDKAGTHARGLIREAGRAWENSRFEVTPVAELQKEIAAEQLIQPLKQMPTKMESMKLEPLDNFAGPEVESVSAQESQPTAREPQPTAREPQPTAQEPQPTAREPQPTAQVEQIWSRGLPQAQPIQPRVIEAKPLEFRESQPATQGSQPATQGSQPATQEPQPEAAEPMLAVPEEAKPIEETEESASDSEDWVSASVEEPVQAAEDEPAVDDEPRVENPVGSLDPEDRARVEELLRQFRKKFGQTAE